MKIKLPFGASLIASARLPENEERSLVDPFAEAKRTWILSLILAVLAGAFLALWRAH